MRKTPFLLSALCLCLFASVAAAQTPAKVMVFDREDIKPGKYAEHVRESNNFVRALAKAGETGAPTYYRVGMSPIAGNTNEVMYVWFFDSLDQWARSQNDIENWLTNPGPVKAYFDQLSEPSRGREDLHSLQRSMVGVLRPDLSLNARPSGRARYFTATTLRVKPGHMGDFMRIAAMYIGAVRKMKSDDHWGMYEIVGGAREGTFVAVSGMESLAEMDKLIAGGPEFVKALGDDLDDFENLVAKAMDPSDTTIYAINPHMSHVPKQVMDADRAFWGRPLPPDDAATLPASRALKVGTRRRAQR